MYKDNSQLRIEDFVFPYGKLDNIVRTVLANELRQGTQTDDSDF